ncbi:hypothetical protein KIN20_034242 [Parelaphostrongylus tenuis]|uniref:Uncharacterized protein n=1 Tax=Parelaphostrongylus tenuis TaxID=148309 RepID=A0AAD5RA26_PARTN|nr:hypothetical protein KIN20_034242 [Parelaphostrongylus tenuis]
MAMYALLRNKPTPTEADINEALQVTWDRTATWSKRFVRLASSPNLVEGLISSFRSHPHTTSMKIPRGRTLRCTITKFVTIRLADLSEASEALTLGFALGKNNDTQPKDGSNDSDVCNGDVKCNGMVVDKNYRQKKIKLVDLSHEASYDPSQEIIFPPEIQTKSLHLSSFAYDQHETKWYQPTSYRLLHNVEF